MAFRKINGPFVAISAELAQREDITAGCLGVLVYLLSKPDGWRGRNHDIERRFKIGTHARRKVVMEAERLGYLKYVRVHEKGQLDCYYEVHPIALPESERTDSSKMNGVEKQPPENQGVENQPPENQPPENQPPENQPPENRGATYKDITNKEIRNKEAQNTPRLMTAEELSNRLGIEYTAEEIDQAQQVLFRLKGQAYCVRETPKIQAYIRNLKTARGSGAVEKLLLAIREPARFGISTTWPLWKIDEGLFPATNGRGQVIQPTPTEDGLMRAARERLRASRAAGETDQDYLAYGLGIPQEYKRRALAELDATSQ